MASIHQPHPKCSGCGRALFKAPEVGTKVLPTDEYQYCRNVDCDQYCFREQAPAPEAEPTPSPVPEPPPPPAGPPPRTAKRRSRGADEVAPPVPPPPPAPEAAPEVVAKASSVVGAVEGDTISVVVARERIRALLSQAISDKTPVAVGLVLAIVNQELGCHAGANALIDQFRLDTLFGLERFTDGSPDSSDAST